MKDVLDLVWASDENYVFLAGVSMTSVFENNADYERIRVWFLADRLSQNSYNLLENCAKKYGREIYFLEVDNLLQDIINTGARTWGDKASYSAYSRLYLEYLLRDKGVEKAIYCDCDLIIADSLRKVMEWNLEEKAIGLVMDYNRVEIRDLVGLSRTAKYYNTGFMLMDLKKWREHKCTERILDHMANIRAVYPYVDQDLINAVLPDEISTLPMEYNVNPRVMLYSYRQICIAYGMNEENYYSKDEYEYVHNGNVKVYHCSDPAAGKPWQTENRHVYSEIWNTYFEKSLWKDIYVKEKYHPNVYSEMQHILSKIMPKTLYVVILGCVAKRMMKKLVLKYE